MTKRTDVVISQGQSQNPVKRRLEEDIVTALMMESGINVTVIPHLYDLTASDTAILALQGISSDMILVSWLYGRPAHWTLDSHGIRGRVGKTGLDDPDEETPGDSKSGSTASESDEHRVIDDRPLPPRRIYCLHLSCERSATDFVEEVTRIARELATKMVELRLEPPKASPPNESLIPTSPTAVSNDPGSGNHSAASAPSGHVDSPARIDQPTRRRWYPVIDFSRCTNCMECIDFCLFGVYGIDDAETILVEQPDACRKGCPACSRVCPENAIMFPPHKVPAIAGALDDMAGMKIDLSSLFGGAKGQEAGGLAAQEREKHLRSAGRNAIGSHADMPKRQADQPPKPKDELDDLIDALDDELA